MNLTLIKKFEGCRLRPYLCSANVPTVGYGSTYYADGTKVQLSDDPITQQQADELLLKTIQIYIIAVNEFIKSNINQNQREALISFVYNVGIGNFKSSTLLKKVNANPNDPTIKDEFLRWNKAGGKIIQGLTNRRIEEAKVYFSI